MSAPARTFTVRNVQLVRALFAAAAAVMITFSPDHSAAVGLSVFSGFAFVTAFVLALAAGLVLPSGQRWSYIQMAAAGVLAGMATGIPAWRTDDLFFVVVIAWAALTGFIELLSGIRARRTHDPIARDSITIGALTLLLAVLLLLVPPGLSQAYSIEGAGDFWLTGIIVGVGLFGGYAAILAVFLGIAGLSPVKSAEAGPSAAQASDAPDAGTETGDAPTASPERGGL